MAVALALILLLPVKVPLTVPLPVPLPVALKDSETVVDGEKVPLLVTDHEPLAFLV